MLVLSRKVGERIVVPELNLTLMVIAIEGNQVRLGITAPPEIGIYREELWNRVCANSGASSNRSAVK
jgi:carbon storage regulator